MLRVEGQPTIRLHRQARREGEAPHSQPLALGHEAVRIADLTDVRQCACAPDIERQVSAQRLQTSAQFRMTSSSPALAGLARDLLDGSLALGE